MVTAPRASLGSFLYPKINQMSPAIHPTGIFPGTLSKPESICSGGIGVLLTGNGADWRPALLSLGSQTGTKSAGA